MAGLPARRAAAALFAVANGIGNNGSPYFDSFGRQPHGVSLLPDDLVTRRSTPGCVPDLGGFANVATRRSPYGCLPDVVGFPNITSVRSTNGCLPDVVGFCLLQTETGPLGGFTNLAADHRLPPRAAALVRLPGPNTAPLSGFTNLAAAHHPRRAAALVRLPGPDTARGFTNLTARHLPVRRAAALVRLPGPNTAPLSGLTNLGARHHQRHAYRFASGLPESGKGARMPERRPCTLNEDILNRMGDRVFTSLRKKIMIYLVVQSVLEVVGFISLIAVAGYAIYTSDTNKNIKDFIKQSTKEVTNDAVDEAQGRLNIVARFLIFGRRKKREKEEPKA